MNSDGELLATVLSKENFLESAIKDDALDWGLVKRLADFLIRIEPDSEIMGHALKARACRHLGEQECARNELKECQNRITRRGFQGWEKELLYDLLQTEDVLSGGTGLVFGS